MLTLLTFLINSVVNFALGLGVAYYLGASEFGTFALAAAAGTVLQTLFFEWLRLAANRFYGEKQRAEDPGIISTLNRTTGGTAAVLSVIALVIFLGGGTLGTTALVAAMAPLIAISGGLYDYRTALARAGFQHKRYAALVIIKNVIAFILMLGGAYLWHRADIVLFGMCLSALAGVAVSARYFQEHAEEKGQARSDLVRQFAVYSAPIVLASIIFLANMFLARSGVALHHGLAESGRYSLALDIGLKLVATLGSGLDLVLFQLAVRAEAEQGAEAAQAQLSRNIGIVLAVILPATAGIWLVLPSFEALFVSESYRGAFSAYTTVLLPGLLAFALIQYAVNPLFQIARKTTPVIVSALASLVVTAGILFLVPGTNGSHGAWATTAGLLAGLVVIAGLAWRVVPVALPWSDIARTMAATALMVLVSIKLRDQAPGISALVLTAAVGGGAYSVAALALDLCGVRTALLRRLRRSASS